MIIFGYDNFIMILINVYEVDSPGVKTHYCSLKSLMRNHLPGPPIAGTLGCPDGKDRCFTGGVQHGEELAEAARFLLTPTRMMMATDWVLAQDGTVCAQ